MPRACQATASKIPVARRVTGACSICINTATKHYLVTCLVIQMHYVAYKDDNDTTHIARPTDSECPHCIAPGCTCDRAGDRGSRRAAGDLAKDTRGIVVNL
jgi:hypothetical protein